MLFYIVCMTDCAVGILECIITDWVTDFSVFFFFNLLYILHRKWVN